VGKGIDLGNTSDIDFIDAISYFAEDEDTRIIVLHMEGITEARKFISTCRRVVKSKPIIALKGGWSASGSKAALSHTGSLSGNNELYHAMFKEARILEADSIAGIGDFTKAFLALPPFTGNRVAVISPTGAGGIITLDAVEKNGFQPAVFSQETINEIGHLFQRWTRVGNPLDILSAGMAHGYKQVYRKVLGTCLRDENVDSVVALCGAHTLKTITPIAAMYPHKPLILWIMGADQALISEKSWAYDFVPYYRSPDRALYALKLVREYYRYKAAAHDKGRSLS
jgi:acetyltransferase